MACTAQDPAAHPLVPIAIVGMSCRLPGDITDTIKFWDLLENRQSAHSDVPPTRFNADGFYSPASDHGAASGLNSRGGYFISSNIKAFDNAFFNISKAEALHMDPQQRILLEVVFESIENAGFTLEKLAGSDTGSFVASFAYDYAIMQSKDADHFSRFSATGMGPTLLSNRINHAFDLRGPSMTIDTACSSSLYCLHQACQALQSRDCGLAIVAGANLILSVEQSMAMTEAGVLSPTSMCHTFSADADGYARAEGVASLCVKRLDDAQRDGDSIQAIIPGTVVASNGKTAGISSPNSDAQVTLLQKLFRRTSLSPDSITFVECHGTGTRAGDSAEIGALSKAFGSRTSENPLLVGSVKTNVGHSEAVSGLTSIIKATLMLNRRRIAASIGIDTLSPAVQGSQPGIKVVVDSMEWPEHRPRRALVNSFGYGGALGSAVIEAYDQYSRSAAELPQDPRFHPGEHVTILNETSAMKRMLLPFSADTHLALRQRFLNDIGHLNDEGAGIDDFATILGSKRSHMSCRGYIVSDSNNIGIHHLGSDLQTLTHVLRPSRQPLCFIFTGQGAQSPQMGMELFERFAVFRESMVYMDEVLQSLPHPPSWSLRSSICEPPDTSIINRAALAQPTTTALQIALVQLLASWEILPEVVIGHSSGEIAAAFAAGKITIAEAIVAAFYRGYLNERNKVPGAMAAVGIDEKMAHSAIHDAGLDQKMRVACINSPNNVTVSGDADAVFEFASGLETKGILARVLKTGGKAYHSHHMVPLGPQLEEILPNAVQRFAPSRYCANSASFISSVRLDFFHESIASRETSDGERWRFPASDITIANAEEHSGIPKSTGFDASYWRANMESPVLFFPAVERVMTAGGHHFLEIGPHSTLSLPLKQIRNHLTIPEEQAPYTASIQRGSKPVDCLLRMAGQLFIHGLFSRFDLINDPSNGIVNKNLLSSLPAYPWQHNEEIWYEPRASEELRTRSFPHHELLGSRVMGGNGITISWCNLLSSRRVEWLDGHQLENVTVFPAAGYVAMAIEAFRQVSVSSPSIAGRIMLENVELLNALILLPDSLEIFTTLEPEGYDTTKYNFMIVTYHNKASTVHAKGMISTLEVPSLVLSSPSTSTSEVETTSIQDWYNKFNELGMNFADDFVSLKEVRPMQPVNDRTQSFIDAKLHLETEIDLKGGNTAHRLHPADIDSTLQSMIIAESRGILQNLKGRVPVSIRKLVIHPSRIPPTSTRCKIVAKAEPTGTGVAQCCASLSNDDGHAFLQVDEVWMTAFGSSIPTSSNSRRQAIFDVFWQPDPLFRSATCPSSPPLQGVEATFDDDESCRKIAESANNLPVIMSHMVHKIPGLRIVEIFNDFEDIKLDNLNQLQKCTRPYDYEYFIGYLVSSGEVLVVNSKGLLSVDVGGFQSFENAGFNLVVLHETIDLVKFPPSSTLLHICSGAVAMIGNRHFKTQNLSEPPLSNSEFSYDLADGINTLAYQGISFKSVPGPGTMLLIDPSSVSPLAKLFIDRVTGLLGPGARVVTLDKMSLADLQSNPIVFAACEFQLDWLINIQANHFEKLKLLISNATKIVWVASSSSLGAHRIFSSPIAGISRSAMLEQPALSFITFQVPTEELELQETAYNFLAVSQRGPDLPHDSEFAQLNGMIHVSRLWPNRELNQEFRRHCIQEKSLERLDRAEPFQLELPVPSQFKSFFLKQLEIKRGASLMPGHVEVSIKSVILDNESLKAMHSKSFRQARDFTFERKGVIVSVADDVQGFRPGEFVTVVAPASLQSTGIFPGWACIKVANLNDEYESRMSPILTALWVLQYHFRIRAGETLLITDPASPEGCAAVAIAKHSGVQVRIDTQSTEETMHEFVFNTDRTKAARGIFSCGPCGKYLELSSTANNLEQDNRQLISHSKVSYYTFELRDLFAHYAESNPNIWQSLLSQAKLLLDEGVNQSFLLAPSHDIAKFAEVAHHLQSSNDGIGIRVSLANASSMVPTQLLPRTARLSSTKTYLIVGGLGGLGRSLITWMSSRGACKFTILSRSGASSQRSKTFVGNLIEQGAEVKVVAGDVSELRDVQRALTTAQGPIGGIVHTAMSLSESLFQSMTHNAWSKVVAPKAHGAQNIQRALLTDASRLEHLDFLLLISSTFGTVGGATQSNYCTANHFLDLLASQARSQRIPAVSLSLGMISGAGYLHEHPEERELIARSGISVLSEDDMLQIVELAISGARDPDCPNHILTGLESNGLEAARSAGVDVPGIYSDPRLSHLLHSYRATSTSNDAPTKTKSKLPSAFTAAIQSGATPSGAATAALKEQFQVMTQSSAGQIDVRKPLTGYGMDSLLGTELKTWIWKRFGIDIPFFELLKSETSLAILGALVGDQLATN